MILVVNFVTEFHRLSRIGSDEEFIFATSEFHRLAVICQLPFPDERYGERFLLVDFRGWPVFVRQRSRSIRTNERHCAKESTDGCITESAEYDRWCQKDRGRRTESESFSVRFSVRIATAECLSFKERRQELNLRRG
jgi:hypothetical protein